MIRRLRHDEPPPDNDQAARYYDAYGYVVLRWKVGVREYVECFEHRYVMGNPPPWMHVHHKNHVKDDNRPENLEVVSRQEHGVRHREIDTAWCWSLYSQGRTLPEIGEITGWDHGAIWRALEREGYKTRSRSESQRMDINEDALRWLAQQGVPRNRIADSLGIERGVIHRRCRLLGIDTGRPGPPTREERNKADAALREAAELGLLLPSWEPDDGGAA